MTHPAPRSGSSIRNNIARLLPHVPRRRRRQLALLILVMLVGACAELLSLGAVVPFVAVIANPAAVYRHPAAAAALDWSGLTAAELPAAISVGFCLLVLGSALARLVLLKATIRYANGLGAELSLALYEKTLHRPYSFHVSRNTSQIIGSVNKIGRVIVGYVIPLLNGITAVVMVLAIVGLLVAIQPHVAIGGVLLFSGAYMAVAVWARKRLRRSGKIIAQANDKRIQAVQEGLGGIRDILLDNAQAIYARRFERIEARFRDAQAGSQFIGAFPRVAVEAIGMLLLAGFAVVFGRNHSDIASLLPTIGIMAFGAQKLLPLVQQIYSGWSSMLNTQASVDDVLELLEYQPPPPHAGTIAFRDAIRLADVGFSYANAEDAPAVLQGIDLTIRHGEWIGIAGPTGSGKSTLVDLLMGLLTPTSGTFLVDQQAVDAGNAVAWQRHIAHVPQTIYLSDSSIAENIAFGQAAGSIDHARVEAAARAAQIHDHVATLPEGYRTVVGERGVRMSGGQRQRIGIARAIYKQVDVLVLDEATSALDDDTERRVMQGIAESAEGMTVIMIAHRLSTMQDCDRILRLESGRIVAEQDYATLLASRGNEA